MVLHDLIDSRVRVCWVSFLNPTYRAGGIGVSALEYIPFAILATPFGWVGLIFAGVAIAGGSVGVSMTVDNYIKDHAGDVYDYLER